MHIRAFGLRATIVLRDEFLSWKVLRDARSMGTAALDHRSRYPELLGVILFTDEATFTRDSVNNSRNVHTWSQDNPHETIVTNFQRRFSVNVWCGVIDNRLIVPFVFDNNLTGDTYKAFLRNELPGLLEDILLKVRSQMYFQHDGAPPHFS